MYINAKGCCRQRSDNGQVKTAKGQCCREGGARRGQCNQMAQNLQKLHKHTHAQTHCEKGHMRHMQQQQQQQQRQLATHAKIFARGQPSRAGQRRVAGRVPCVDFSLLRPSTVASSKPTAAAAAAGRRQQEQPGQQEEEEEEVEEELAVTLPTVSTAAAAALLLLLLPSSCCCCCSTPATPVLASLLLLLLL